MGLRRVLEFYKVMVCFDENNCFKQKTTLLFHLCVGEKGGEERIDSSTELARKRGGNRREVGQEDS